MLKLYRQTEPSLIDSYLNHPSVLPWVSGGRMPPLCAEKVIDDPGNVVLCCDWGGLIFVKLLTGFYEAHTCVLPVGRGRGTLELVHSALWWMFTKTDAIEIITRVPHGNVSAKTAIRALGAPFWFTTQPIWPVVNSKVKMDVYKLHLFDWIDMEREALEKEGQHFHSVLRHHNAVDHADDPLHDAYVGAAMDIIRGGQPDKAVATYNLWASLSGYGTISIASREPLLIDIGPGVISPETGEFHGRRAA